MDVTDGPRSWSPAPGGRDEQRFVVWLMDPRPRNPATLALEQRRLGALVGRLASSEATMPEACCARLGLSVGSSFGTAARWLSWATVSPEGPRCRSYRSAAFFVHGLVAGISELAQDLHEHADAEVALTAATALGLAYSQRASSECRAELGRAADASTLRAARACLIGHPGSDEELVERARSLLADAAVETEGAR